MADGIFQIGENIIGYLTNVGTDKVQVYIEGTGRMYESRSQYICLKVLHNVIDYKTWNPYLFVGDVVIPDGIEFISNQFLWSASPVYVDNLYIGKDVETIGFQAFQGFDSSTKANLKKIICNSTKLKRIGDQAFAYQHNLTDPDINFHGTVNWIGSMAFYNSNVKTLNLSTEIEYIGHNAFDGCTKLINFNKNNYLDLEDLGNASFKNCNSLEYIWLGSKPKIKYGGLDQKFYVAKNAGSNCDSDGNQITTIYGNNASAFTYEWDKDNRTPIFKEKPPLEGFLVLKHNNKYFYIDGYESSQGQIPIAHMGEYRYLKVSEQHSNNQTPLFIADKGKWKQVQY